MLDWEGAKSGGIAVGFDPPFGPLFRGDGGGGESMTRLFTWAPRPLVGRGWSIVVTIAPVFVCGCATVAGHWLADGGDGVTQDGSLTAISFNGDGRYAATEITFGSTSTVVGRYDWNGRTLTLTSNEGEVRRYRCRPEWNGRLSLVDSKAHGAGTIRLRRRE